MKIGEGLFPPLRAATVQQVWQKHHDAVSDLPAPLMPPVMVRLAALFHSLIESTKRSSVEPRTSTPSHRAGRTEPEYWHARARLEVSGILREEND